MTPTCQYGVFIEIGDSVINAATANSWSEANERRNELVGKVEKHQGWTPRSKIMSREIGDWTEV